MNKPSIGRTVHYTFRSKEDAEKHNNTTKVAAAVITAVWSDTCVNLKVLTDGPTDIWETSVNQSEAGEAHSWNWPAKV